MEFSKEQIVKFKSKGRGFITWRKSLEPSQIKKFFYNDDDSRNIKVLFPDKNLEYCQCHMYEIVVGDYQLGLKYVNENGTYYMFLSANSFWAPPQDVAIGKAVEGKIYLIREHLPNDDYCLTFREIPEEYINRNESGFRPRSYNHFIYASPSHIEEASKDITYEDLKCFNIAYEGVCAFGKLIEEIS